MKLNICDPRTGGAISLDIDNEKLLVPFLDKRIGQEVAADSLGDEWKGYVLKVKGGNDKEGFAMYNGVLTDQRVRLLLKKGCKCFRERRAGQRKRKSVRGCIVATDLSALNLTVAQAGEATIEKLNASVLPKSRGPKRASKIRKLFNLSKDDNVADYVIKKVRKEVDGKVIYKSPKIQRLMTDKVRARKVREVANYKAKREAASRKLAAYRQALSK